MVENYKRITVLFLFVISNVYGTTYYSMVANGSWTSGSTWSTTGASGPTCNCTPPSGGNNDVIIIEPGDVITDAGSFTLGNGCTLTVNANATLNITGTLTMGNNAILTVNGTFVCGGLGLNNNATINVASGAGFTVNGNLTAGNNGAATINGTVSVSGNATFGSGTSISGTGTVSTSGTFSTGSGSTVFGSSGGSCTNCSVSTSSPLPITLLSFTGNHDPDRDIVNLLWTTTSEVNNRRFIVQRSTDGMNWAGIDTVAGAGNSDATLNYSVADMNPPQGIVYYRLQQQDFDGHIQTFNVLVFNITHSSVVRLYPNPASSLLFVQGNISQMTVFDMCGRQLLNTLSKGTQNFIDVTSLSSGVYILQAVDNTEKVYSMKFVKE